MSRARRIAQYLHDHPNGIGVTKIRDSVDPDASLATIGSQLAQLIEAGKVRRTGAGRSAVFFPTADVVTDRRVGKAPNPSAPKATIKPSAKPEKATPAPTPVASRARTRSGTFAPLKPRQAIPNAAPETVEEFLARGGRIQYCKPGECGYSPSSYRERSQAHRERVSAEVIARHKAKPRNAIDINDDEADDDLEAAA